MVKTIEDLDKEYENKEIDNDYLLQQAVLGSREDAKLAYNEHGEFHCIHWFNCCYCPAFNKEHCL